MAKKKKRKREFLAKGVRRPVGRRVTAALPRSFVGVKFGHEGGRRKKKSKTRGGLQSSVKKKKHAKWFFFFFFIFSWMPFAKRTKVNKPKASSHILLFDD